MIVTYPTVVGSETAPAEMRHVSHTRAFEALLDRIAAAADWGALEAIWQGVDDNWREMGMTAIIGKRLVASEEVDLIARNILYRATKIPEHVNADYAEAQMDALKAIRSKKENDHGS